MGQNKVRCIKFENLFHLTIVPLNQKDNFNFSINGKKRELPPISAIHSSKKALN